MGAQPAARPAATPITLICKPEAYDVRSGQHTNWSIWLRPRPENGSVLWSRVRFPQDANPPHDSLEKAGSAPSRPVHSKLLLLASRIMTRAFLLLFSFFFGVYLLGSYRAEDVLRTSDRSHVPPLLLLPPKNYSHDTRHTIHDSIGA